MNRISKKFFFTTIACLFSVCFATSLTALAQSGLYSLSYSGRLTQADGAPLSGPVDVTVKFWTAATAGNTLTAPIELTNINLNQGMFTLPLELNSSQMSAVFGQGTDPVFIEITASGKTYPRQQYTYVPFALRVPVDGKTLAFDGDGKLGLSLSSQPAANQFLTKDSNGRLSWGSPSVTTLQGQNIASTAPTSGQILTYSGGQWVPQTLSFASAAGGTVTNVSGTAPLTVTSGTTTPVISMAQASGSSNGYLSAADWTTFNSKPGTAVTSVATGTGLIGGPITSSGTISLNNTSVTPGSYTRANISVDAQGRLVAAANGASVNLTSEVSGTLPVVNGGTGAATFTNNGILVGSGSLPVSTVTGSQYQVLTSGAGGAPSFGSLSLDQSAAVTGILPRANGGTGVNSTATFPVSGVIVTEEAPETLTNKTLTGATINGASSIGGSTTIDTAGTIKSGAATVAGNVTIVGNDTTANKLVLNDKGSANSVALKAPDTLALSFTLELPSSNGSSGQVLSTNGSGILSWVSAAVGSVTNVTGTAPISVANGTSTPVISMSQANGTTNGYLSSADWTTFISKQASGNYLTSLTGDVTAAGPGSATASLAAVAIAGTSTKVTYDVKGRVTSGTSLEAADLPSHSAALITSGTLATANGGTGANLSSTGGAGQYLKQTTAGGSVTVGTIAAGDITSSLGYTPLNKAGDTVTGALNLGANDLSNSGNILMAASKTLALSTNATDPSGLGASDVGKTWFNSSTNQIKYWNGSAAIALGAAGSGLSNLNGQTGNTQTFAVPGTTGTAPAWSSANNAHTLNVPMASAASVTAGLLSNTDYAAFSGKLSAVAQGTGVAIATSSGTATVSLGTIGTAGNYSKVTTDAYGRVSSGTALTAADIPPISAAIITSGTLAAANGGTGVNSTATFPTSGVVVTRDATETLTNKTFSAATINGASSIGGSTTINTTGTVNSGAQTVTGNVTILGNTTTANKLVLNDKGSTNSVALKAPDTLTSSLTWELPSTNGSSGQLLSTNGAGTLSWVSTAVGSVTNVTGTAPISVATGTSTPVISMSQANGTTNGYLGSADWTTFNSKQAAGNYITTLTGDMTLSGFTSGSAAATLATVATAGTSTKVTYDAKGRVTSGTTLTAADIPAHSATLISSGTLAVANGGTGVSSTTANSVFAGPPSGSGAPSFRTLVAGDLPAMSGANGTTAGTAGAVPGPAATDNVKFLRGDGTWAAPAAAAAGATNQIQYNSAGALTGNANFVYSGGNVGIGTTNPQDKLTIAGNTNNLFFRTNSDSVINNGMGLRTSNTGFNLNIDSYSNIAFHTDTDLNEGGGASTEKMRITTTGNVGIGTTAPSANLHVSGLEIVQKDDASVVPYQLMIRGNSNNTQQLLLGYNTTSDYGSVQAVLNGTAYKSLALNPSGGNVGIGTTSPGSILHLNGANPSITLQPTAGGPQSGIQFVTPTNTAGMSIGRDRNSTGTNDMFFYDQVAGATRMYISSTGNVGIGTTAPAAALDVGTGNIKMGYSSTQFSVGPYTHQTWSGFGTRCANGLYPIYLSCYANNSSNGYPTCPVRFNASAQVDIFNCEPINDGPVICNVICAQIR